MKFRRIDDHFAESDPPGYIVNLAHLGTVDAYCAVRRGDGAGPEIVHVERDVPLDKNHPDRLAAWRACVAACEDDARVR